MLRPNRLAVRIRVTLAFTGAMALVLAATGLFLHVRLGAELDNTIDQGLHSRAGDVSALVRQAGTGLREAGRSPLIERGENLAQILDGAGRIVDATPAVMRRPLLTPAEVGRAQRATITLDKDRVPGSEDPVRLLGTPVRAKNRRLVVVVATALDDRNDALAHLDRLMLLGGPVALLLASLAGYGAAAGALRPVEQMRRRAAAIGAGEPGGRLPVGPADDEIGRLGVTLNAMLDRLDAAFARERTFVADASHELRTPLAILKAELELALRGEHSADELRAAVQSGAEETDRLVQLAEDLLVITRADQGRLPISARDTPAADVLDGARRRFGKRVSDADATLAVAASDGLRVLADPLRLEQAVGNLVDNALRHGGPHIELTVAAAGDHVELHVRDDGPGFPEDFVATAFERFTRADPARGRGGTGLGLGDRGGDRSGPRRQRRRAQPPGGRRRRLARASRRAQEPGGSGLLTHAAGGQFSPLCYPVCSPSGSTATTLKLPSSRTSTWEPSGLVTSTS